MSGFQKQDVLILGFPAFGHLIPLLELGKKISKYHHVTFVVSLSLQDELQNRELFVKTPENELQIAFLEDDLKAGEFDNYSPDTHFAIFESAFNRISTAATTFLQSVVDRTSTISSARPINVVIADNMYGTPLKVLHAADIPFYLFNTANCGLALAAALCNENYPVCDKPEDNDVFHRAVPPGAPPPPMASFLKKLFLEMKQVMPLSHGIIVNSFHELESDLLAVLSSLPRMKGIGVSCVGPLFPDENEYKPGKHIVADQVQRWLDQQSEASVVYVSFGSYAVPAPEQLEELGKSLLLLNKPFILSLRTCFQQFLPNEIGAEIVAQFNASNSLFLVLPWSPQKLILKHPATAVFVSHCGWNSVLESMCGGVPVVGWPLFGDQLMNAEALASHGMAKVVLGAGVKPERVVLKEEIKDVICLAAGWTNNQKGDSSLTVAAKIWKDKIQIALGKNGSSETEFQALITLF